jgi:formamidopyrimidine-DNA glycosylase
MPELPEVEHVVRALRPFVVGRRILASEIRLPKLSAPTSPSLFKRKLKGATTPLGVWSSAISDSSV